ncbi:hypothetical protein INT45_007817 [Circinella minor]|uniref:Uncharacterized protein n=1 Tax=Circinella minor TaxID=1195481 RepID=A0A8H7VDC3_9FUNG|nr:hypothetical protein INT45_007817 [Circinella minor]
MVTLFLSIYWSLATLETEEHWSTVASVLANVSQHQSYLHHNNNTFKRAIDYQEEASSDDLYKIPSDLTDNKHPARKSSVYNLSYSIEPEAHADLDMTDDWWSQDARFNILRACRQFKYSSILVSICIIRYSIFMNFAEKFLVTQQCYENYFYWNGEISYFHEDTLSQTYLFSEEWKKSVAKYLGWDRHTSITDSLAIGASKPEVTAQSLLLYATNVSMSLNENWLSVVKSISQFISEATTSEVQLDINTSIALLKL